MTRRIVRWMRIVLPDSTLVTVCIALEMLIEVIYIFLLWRGWFPDEATFRDLRLFWMSICSMVYGIGRVVQFHPAFDEEYRNWLNATPWTSDKPLPGGPIRQIPQDLLVIAAMMLLTRISSTLVLWIPVVSLVGYLVSLAFATRICGDWAFAYLIGFAIGGIGLAATSPVASCVVAMASYPIAVLAIRRSLRCFPWDIDWTNVKKYARHNQQAGEDRLGWPHDQLSPRSPQHWIPYSDGISVSLLAGWYALVVHFQVNPHIRHFLCVIALQSLSVVAIGRLGTYASSHWWPISLWGRLWTFRWIIPRYDVIFVAPLLAVLVLFAGQLSAIGLFFLSRKGNIPNPTFEWLGIACSSGGITATLLLILVMGPALEWWRLAGKHRIVFDQRLGGKTSQSPFIEL